MWMKVHYIQNTSTGLKLSNFTIFDQEKNLGKIIIRDLALRIRTQDLQALTHCAILVNILGKKQIMKLFLILLFTSIGSTSR